MAPSIQIPLMSKALGGILPGRAYLFHGASGVGKSVLAIQMAHAWVRAGQAVLYVTASRASELLEQADALGLSLDEPWRSGQLVVCRYNRSVSKQLEAYGPQPLLERIDACRPDGVAGRAVVFDPLDPLLRMRGRGTADILAELLATLAEGGWSVLLLASRRAWKRNRAAAERLRDHCWATVALDRPRRGWFSSDTVPRGTYRLTIEKARQMTPNGSELYYEIVGGAGLIPAAVGESPPVAGLTRDPTTLPRILLASEDTDLFKPLAGLLQRTVETRIVGDGVEALSRAVTWKPSAMVVETALPRLSGFAISRALRQGRYGMPILLVSRATRRHSERVRAYLNGASDFVYFPFDMAEMVYKVQVAAQMRLHIFQTGLEEHLMEVLLQRARSHILDIGTFQQALSLSLHSGIRFSSPVSLVTFRLAGQPGSRDQEALWQRFRELLDQRVRSGDLICFPDACRAAVLLSHETRRGAAAFVQRLQEAIEGELIGACGETPGWRIECSMRTMSMPTGESVDVSGLFEAAFEAPRTFLTPGGEVDSETDGQRRWGT